MALTAIILLPLLAALLCWLPPVRKAAWQVTVFFQAVEFVLALYIAAEVISHGQEAGARGGSKRMV